jgi:hypothetical protein
MPEEFSNAIDQQWPERAARRDDHLRAQGLLLRSLLIGRSVPAQTDGAHYGDRFLSWNMRGSLFWS